MTLWTWIYVSETAIDYPNWEENVELEPLYQIKGYVHKLLYVSYNDIVLVCMRKFPKMKPIKTIVGQYALHTLSVRI